MTASKKTSPFGFNREFEILEPSGTATAFTTPSFDSSAVAKSLNSVLLSRSFRTLISNPYRKSGLSLPYFSIASL